MQKYKKMIINFDLEEFYLLIAEKLLNSSSGTLPDRALTAVRKRVVGVLLLNLHRTVIIIRNSC